LEVLASFAALRAVAFRTTSTARTSPDFSSAGLRTALFRAIFEQRAPRHDDPHVVRIEQ
jgi:hypothetical protein